ncbi:MAG TPA: beta-phosphoglucomutase [Candidatus Ligilactobacillus excrementavium]|nr:beta-phosphoglucomutase [Candidatus Ligilactobacillus excrementavium]
MKGVLFDLDGILTDTAKFHFAAWSRLAQEELGVILPAEFESELKGVSRVDSLVRIMDYAGIMNNYSPAEIKKLANKKNDYYVKAISSLTREDILPGITEFLDELTEHQVACAIASASKNAPLILKNLGLSDYFAAIADPAKVAHGKPAPDIFLAAADTLGIDPKECVGIEDAVAGVTAIKASGALAIGVGDTQELKEADIVVPTTNELDYKLLTQTFAKKY